MANDYDEAVKRYPDWAWALNVPGVGDIVRKYLTDPDADAGAMQTEIQQTPWFRGTQASARLWDAGVARDPATADAQRREKQAQIWDMYLGMGLNPDPNKVVDLAEKSLRFGWQDAQLTDAISSQLQYDSTNPVPLGSVGVYMQTLKKTAANYFVPLTDETAFQWSKSIMAGEHKPEDYSAILQEQSKGRFPTLAAVIDKGVSPQQYFSTYQQQLGQLLEKPADAIDFVNDPKFAQVIDHVDDKGERRPMTLAEAGTYARGMDEWKGTRQGQEAAATAADGILKMFGKVA